NIVEPVKKVEPVKNIVEPVKKVEPVKNIVEPGLDSLKVIREYNKKTFLHDKEIFEASMPKKTRTKSLSPRKKTVTPRKKRVSKKMLEKSVEAVVPVELPKIKKAAVITPVHIANNPRFSFNGGGHGSGKVVRNLIKELKD
ncbi:MAG: hypothetical protein WCG01_04160, partial [bacterium]